MHGRRTLLISIISVFSFLAHADDRKNVIFILSDDQRWNALGCMGDKNAKTPNLDQLAADGVLFTNHFVTTSICCVSRASLFSGQYESRHRIDDFNTDFSPQAWKRTYPALFREAGYYTGFIGKFGVGKNLPAKSFDFWRGLPGQAFYFKPPDPRHSTAMMGDQAIEFLKGVPQGRPFCLSVSFKAPHSLDHGPREYAPDPRDEELFKDTSFPVPETATLEFFNKLPAYVQKSEGHKRWLKRFSTPAEYQRNLRDYYRLIYGLDREVGRIRAALKDLKLDSNTVIVFMSDNGYFYGEHELADKWFMYEESIRVPMIVFDPSLPQSQRGRKCEAMTLNIDVPVTMLDYAEIAAPPVMQGRSLRRLVEGKDVPDWRKKFFYEHTALPKIIPPCEGVRTERYSYIRYVAPNPVVEELYDIQVDPLEKNDLSKDPSSRKVLDELGARWKAMKEEVK